LGYIVPVAVLIGWFPEKRGLITGLAVAGFGLGACITGPLAEQLIALIGVQHTLKFLGCVYAIVVLAAARFLRHAPPRPLNAAGLLKMDEERNCTLSEALRSRRWYMLWATMALNVSAGSALLAVASPLAQELAGMDQHSATFLVVTMAAANGVGRLFWGGLSDKIGRPTTFLALLAVQILAFACLSKADSLLPLTICMAAIALCFGGGFGTMPAFVADLYGAKNAGTIYGAMLSAWSAGAIIGPVLITSFPYRTALLLFVVILSAASLLPLIIGIGRIGKWRRRTAIEQFRLRSNPV
jgi:OFA family oxalate/formate antiporter-like MFS transporter